MPLPSASGLYIADACKASLALPIIASPPSDEADLGSGIHAFMELVIDAYRHTHNLDRAVATGLESIPPDGTLRERCEAIDFNAIPLGGDQIILEGGFVYNFETDVSQLVKTGARHGDLTPFRDHVVGVADFAEKISEEEAWVLDWKSGRKRVYVPSPQLRALGLAVARYFNVPSVTVGNVQILEDGNPRLVKATMDGLDLHMTRLWLRELQAYEDQQKEVLLNRGAVHLAYGQGDHCTFCPAWNSCVAVSRTIATLARAPLNIEAAFEDKLLDGDPAEAFLALESAHTVIKRCWKALYQHVRQRGPIQFTDGTVYGPCSVTRDVIDGNKVMEILRREKKLKNPEQYITLRGTKTGIKSAAREVNRIRKAAKKKSTVAAVESEIMTALAMEGGISEKETTKIMRHRPGEAIKEIDDE